MSTSFWRPDSDSGLTGTPGGASSFPALNARLYQEVRADLQFRRSGADESSMLKGFVYFLMLSSSAQALTRVPAPGTGETSLLYWRYLCRSQPQTETQPQDRKPQSAAASERERRELSCPSQRWKVRTHPGEDKVMEVVEDAS